MLDRKQLEMKNLLLVLKRLLNKRRFEEMPTIYSLQILNQIKQLLPKQTDSKVLTYLDPDPKSSYIWLRLNFLEQQAMLLIYHEEFVRSLSTDFDSDQFQDISTNNILFTIYDSLAISVRRSMEALIELKGFATYNNIELYKIYFCCSEIENLNKAQENRNVFFNAHSKNIGLQIKMSEEDLSDMLKGCPRTDLFFLRSPEDPKFLSMFENLKRNHSLLTPEELLILGYTYKYFSYLSDSAHLRNDLDKSKITIDDINLMYTHLGLILLHTVAILAELTPGIKNKKLDQINNLLKNNSLAKEIFNKYSGKNINIGDYVIAANKIAKVIKINHSSFRYNSYKVKFVDPPLVPEHTVENFLPTEIRFFARGKDIKTEVIKRIGKENCKGKANKESIEKIIDQGTLKMRDILQEIQKSRLKK